MTETNDHVISKHPRRFAGVMAAGAAALALAIAGCGGSSSSASTAPAQQPAAPAQQPVAKHAASGIPQHNGGDMDADNNGGPSDGDGNI